MARGSAALLLAAVVATGALGCGPDRPARNPDDEEKGSKNDARMGPLRTVWEHTDQFKACWEEARRAQSDLAIRVTIDISVDGKGRVTNAFVTSAKPIDDSLKKCMVKVAEGITFPPGGEAFRVKPAFVFPTP